MDLLPEHNSNSLYQTNIGLEKKQTFYNFTNIDGAKVWLILLSNLLNCTCMGIRGIVVAAGNGRCGYRTWGMHLSLVLCVNVWVDMVKVRAGWWSARVGWSNLKKKL